MPGQQSPYPGQPAGYAAPYIARSTEPLAIVSLILGIAGLVFCPLILSIVAIVLAGQADKKIAASNGALEGEGMAKAGRIMGWIGVAFGAAIVIFYVFVIAAISLSGF